MRDGGSPFDRRIVVPFCFQSELSGIWDASFHDVVWYARALGGADEPLILQLGAVGYRSADRTPAAEVFRAAVEEKRG